MPSQPAERTLNPRRCIAMATTHKSHTSSSSSHDTPNALDTEDRKHLHDTTYAFPKQRKEPLNDASPVRNAIAARGTNTQPEEMYRNGHNPQISHVVEFVARHAQCDT